MRKKVTFSAAGRKEARFGGGKSYFFFFLAAGREGARFGGGRWRSGRSEKLFSERGCWKGGKVGVCEEKVGVCEGKFGFERRKWGFERRKFVSERRRLGFVREDSVLRGESWGL